MINPVLKNSSVPRIEILQVYGHRFQHAQYSKLQVDQLGKNLFLRYRGQLRRPTSCLVSQTPGSPPDSHVNVGFDKQLSLQLKTYGIEDTP